MRGPLFSAGTARGGTNLLTYLLSVNPQVSVACDPFLPLFRSLRNAILRHRADSELQQTVDPVSPLGEYYFNPDGIRVMECIQESDLDIPVDPSETPALLDALGRRTALTCPYLRPHLLTLHGRTYAELFRCALQILETARHARDRAWVGFNENWAVEFFAPLARTFPTARFLIIVRDPRAAIASNRRVPDPSLIAHTPSFARHWRKLVAFAVHFQSDPLFAGRLCVVTYEQLVLHPAQTARRLCEFLDVEYDPAMLQTSRYVDLATGVMWNGNSNYEATTVAFDPQRIDRWRRFLDEGAGKAIEFLCDPDLRLFGYQAVHDTTAADPAVLQFFQEEHRAPRHWRTDSQDPEQEFANELLRKSVLAAPERLTDADAIRRTCLFEDVYDRLTQQKVLTYAG